MKKLYHKTMTLLNNKIADITVIVPIHTTNTENFEKYYDNAIQSIIQMREYQPAEIIFIAPPSCMGELRKLPFKDFNVTYLTNDGDTDFASQINKAVGVVKTTYFSFLEFDDEYSDLWFKNAVQYIAENPEVSMFLPIISDASPENKFLGFTNEIAWAYEFTDKQGFVDKDVLKDYPNFNPDGMVMKTAEFKRIGGYKKNIKLAFNLEFLLRACDHGLQIMVIPKIGYKHVNMRPDSIFWEYKNGEQKLDPAESEFWMETAQKEFYYPDDRNIIYTPKISEPITPQELK